jgi:hypothetical protein
MCRSPSIVGSRGARIIRARKLRKKIPAKKSNAGICERKGTIIISLDLRGDSTAGDRRQAPSPPLLARGGNILSEN